MIALYVFLALLALILFLLFVNIHVIFTYGESAKVTVRVLLFRFDGMKLFRRFTQEKKTKKSAESEPAQGGTKRKNRADPLGFVEFLLRIGRIIGRALKEHFSKMKIYLKELHVSIGTADAAETALLYGGAIQAANGLCALLQHYSHFRCDNRNLVIAPDFVSEKSRFSIHLDLTVKAFHLIGVLLRAYLRLFEGKDVQS
ncbi:MAG: DUF2953 domain-containing protein [Clostridia bacterium]|nr:DUF2953 domain-containing protein [Clostridia bacterium]